MLQEGWNPIRRAAKLAAGALTAVTQETTVALANAHFDFSLVKIEAPAEYQELGKALSGKRRKAAEEGSTHETARKLGALFQEALPSTPALLRAYGLRSSEIAQSGLINPKDGRSYGAFAEHVGVDGTSIWAAATSGKGAVAIHLLACMLARIWPASRSISIWEELLEERKRELSTWDESDSISMRSLTTGRISVSREQLAEWDASARAWLRAADRVKEFSQKQLLLIVENLNIPVNQDMNVYTSVMLAWKTAMMTIDKLIDGAGQSVRNGAVLLGLSSWHLYPDLMVLGSVPATVRQRDSLVAAGGIVTLGLRGDESDDSRGVYWSLPLTHVRYYGDPLICERSIDSAQSRINIEDLWQVILASLVKSWEEDLCTTVEAVQLITKIWEKCDQELRLPGKSKIKDKVYTESWLKYLNDPARRYLYSTEQDRALCKKLFGLGQRKCTLLGPAMHNVAIFALDDASLIRILKPDERIAYLRRIACKYSKEGDLLVIKNCTMENGTMRRLHLATVPTQTSCAASRSSIRRTHGSSWLYIIDGSNTASDCLIASGLSQHIDGEECSSLDPNSVLSSMDGYQLEWRNPPAMYAEGVTQSNEDSLLLGRKTKRWSFLSRAKQKIDSLESPEPVAIFEHVFGDVNSAALFRRKNLTGVRFRKIDKQEMKHNVRIAVKEIAEALSAGIVDPGLILEHMMFGMVVPSKDGGETDPLRVNEALRAMATVSKIYSQMSHATISLDVVASGSILTTKWFASRLSNEINSMRDPYPTTLLPYSLSRSTTFSCIAMFESGGFDLDPSVLSTVMAISSGDSIFVAAPLLCDPAKSCEPHEVCRIVGNIGRAGIAFLIPPSHPRIKRLNLETYHIINHDFYDGKVEDHFQATTLHLGFSGYELAIDIGNHGARNTEAFFLESLIRVHDRGEWVADLDALKALDAPSLFISHNNHGTCSSSHFKNLECVGTGPIAIDKWEELLERPRNAGIVRAHGNWIARLATAAVSTKMGNHTIIFTPDNSHVKCHLCLGIIPGSTKTIYIM